MRDGRVRASRDTAPWRGSVPSDALLVSEQVGKRLWIPALSDDDCTGGFGMGVALVRWTVSRVCLGGLHSFSVLSHAFVNGLRGGLVKKRLRLGIDVTSTPVEVAGCPGGMHRPSHSATGLLPTQLILEVSCSWEAFFYQKIYFRRRSYSISAHAC